MSDDMELGDFCESIGDDSLAIVDTTKYLSEYLLANGYDESSNEVTLDCDVISKLYPDMMPFIADTPERIIDEVTEIIRKGVKKPLAIQISHFNDNLIPIRNIRNTHIKKLINIDCVIKKTSDIRQEIVYAAFRCGICGTPLPLFKVDERMIKPPTVRCPLNESHTKPYLEPSACVYRDIQIVSAQERQIDNGRQPKSIMCVLSAGVVDRLSAGNRVRITGYVKVRVDKKNLASMYLEVVNVEKDEDDYSDIVLTDEDIEKVKVLADEKDIYKRLADSINPAIYGYDDIKLALVLQMFGGVTRRFDDGTRIRGESHILLCGDPSTAKSQLVYSVSKIVPRVVYTSGKSTSGAGLTAAVVKDEADDKWTLEAGALPLANGGMVVCDEFDKLGADDRSALHEAMELGSISVNKAGLSEKLITETSLLAAANPKNGRFIRTISIRDQLDLPPSLISRFDLIFTIFDQPDKELDSIVAHHVLASRMGSAKSSEICRPIDIDTMRKYIIYAKSLSPVLTEDSTEYLTKIYDELRSDEQSYITVRQLEALVRLSEASARVRLRDEITVEDTRRAVKLFYASMDSVSLGKGIDVTLFDSKSSKEDLMRKEYVLLMISKNEYDMQELMNLLVINQGMELEEANYLLIDMIKNNEIKVKRIPEEKRSVVIKA